MSPNQNHQDTISSKAGSVAAIANAVVKSVGKQLPSSQVELGDDKLNQARDLLTSEVRSMVDANDLRVIENKFTHAREMKVALATKSGIENFFLAREYHEFAKRVYRDTKFMSDRIYSRFQLQSKPGTLSEADDIYQTARSLYRCMLSCKDAFPSSLTQNTWAKNLWEEACYRTIVHPSPNLFRQDEEFRCSSMKLFNDMKMKTKSAVACLYEFETFHVQALLADATFIYRVFNFGGRPRYPYRHPIIQEIVNITWFQNKEDVGIIFHEYFAPIPLEAIALVLTVVECCIDEWSTGTWKESSWREVYHQTNYLSHLNSLRDLDNRGPHQKGRDLLRRIQDDLLKEARMHAGAPPHPTTGSGKLAVDALEAAIQDGPPEYDSN